MKFNFGLYYDLLPQRNRENVKAAAEMEDYSRATEIAKIQSATPMVFVMRN